MVGQVDAAVLVSHVERQAWLGFVAANVATATLVIPGGAILAPVFFPGIDTGMVVARTVIPGILYVIFSTVSARPIVRRLLRPATRWVIEGREPTDDERQVLATQPRRQAVAAMSYWVVFPLWGVPYASAFLDLPVSGTFLVKFINGLVLLAFVAWTLTYLLVERAVRPLLTIALSRAADPVQRTMSVFTRLLVAWTAAAGLPLWGIMVVLYGLEGRERALAIPYVYLSCTSALVAGIVATAITARAITDPLQKVRDGLRAVEEGALDVDVPVDEASEIGVLQMGFNRMVHGLRERERMREIFGQHVGTDVAARALAGGAGLGGDRRHATAMFVDIIGSTALTHREDADDVVAILNAFFDAVVRAVGEHGGSVNKFQGDGALCLFGVPMEQADHAASALRAARSLYADLHLLDLDAGIGVSSGEVVAGNVGTADRYEYTVIGDAVNEASRLCDIAKSSSVRLLVSSATVALAGDTDGWCEAGRYDLRGRSAETLAYTLT